MVCTTQRKQNRNRVYVAGRDEQGPIKILGLSARKRDGRQTRYQSGQRPPQNKKILICDGIQFKKYIRTRKRFFVVQL